MMMSDLLLWIVPLAVVVAGIVRPAVGLAIFAAALPLFGAPPGGPYLAILDVSALALVVVLWRVGRPVRTPVDPPAAAFVWATFASLLPLAYHPPAWRLDVLAGLAAALPGVERWSILFTWRAAMTALIGWLLFVAVRRLGLESVRWLGWGLAAGLVPTLLLAVGEWTGRVDLGGYRPIGRAIFEGRLQALFFHPAWLAQYLMAAAPLSVVVLWARSPRWRWAAGALAAVSAVVALRTLQRGAWFAVALEIVLAAFLVANALASRRARRRATVLLAIGLVFATGTLIGAAVASDDLLSALPRPLTDLSGRTAVWRAALEMTWDRPLLGWGVGSFSPVYDLLYSEGQGHHESWLTAHNLYLMLSAERGLLGLAAFLLVGAALIGGLVRRLRSPEREVSRTAGAALVSFVGLGLYGLVQYHFFIPAIEWLCWMVAGAAATLTAPGVGVHPRTAPGPAGPTASFAQARRGGAAAKMLALLAIGAGLSQSLLVSPAPPRGDRAFGWHAPEGAGDESFQWTAGRADRRIEREGEVLVVTLANGHPRPKVHPVRVRILVDGKEVDSFRPSGEWEERRIDLGGAASPGSPLVLSIRAEPPFRPFREGHRRITLPESRDLRLLGVAVRPLGWEGDSTAPL